MALKKKKVSKLKGEQLYMLEILVDKLNLCFEKKFDNRECDLMVRTNFIDLTPIDIVVEEFVKSEDRSKSKKNRLSVEHTSHESGKSCLFVRTPNDLIQSIKSIPLNVEVYRIPRSRKNHNSRDEGQLLLCATTAFLPKCFYDRIAVVKNKIDDLPIPYTLKKIYTLTDEQGNPCGFVLIYLKLSCFGSSIINYLTFNEKSKFVFQGFPLGQKFCRTKLSDKDLCDETSRIECDNTLSNVLNLAYSKFDRKNLADATPALTKPESSPYVSMDQPGFEELTSAEKLNDSKYRSLIYEAYPDEPTCSCLPTDRSTHPLMCRSGCVRSCCMMLRNPNILKNNNTPSLAVSTFYNDDVHSNSTGRSEHDMDCCDARMRGGGDKKNVYSNNNNGSMMIWNNDYTWRADNMNLKYRLAGGSECTNEMKAKYMYSEQQNPLSLRTERVKCMKKSNAFVDHLIRAFKEAQEFVDSLGKVPGMEGLGLMDPSESPYFGRDMDKDYLTQETLGERKRGYLAMQPASLNQHLQCTAPCNIQFGKPGFGDASISHAIPAPAMPTIPGYNGIVREALPTLSETTLIPVAAKPKKKENKKEEKLEKQKEQDFTTSVPEDIEVGPCGEPKCKSRLKTAGNDRAQMQRTISQETTKESEKKSATRKPLTFIAAKGIGKFNEKKRYLKDKPGPAGDIGRMPVKVSKRVMRYIYSIGNVYPGIHYGHRNCVDPRMRVPANMGWLWNTIDTVSKLKPRIGWKPGAIGRYLNELLKEAKISSLEYNRPKSVPSRTGKWSKLYKTASYASVKKLQTKKEREEEIEPPPTLHIHRKDGTYYVTMYPIKQDTTDTPQLEEPTKPLQFKIVKNRDDASVATSSTASDMEIEFSPPAAVNRYRRKPDVVHVNIQVRQQEILDALKSVDVPKKKEKKAKERKGKK